MINHELLNPSNLSIKEGLSEEINRSLIKMSTLEKDTLTPDVIYETDLTDKCITIKSHLQIDLHLTHAQEEEIELSMTNALQSILSKYI